MRPLLLACALLTACDAREQSVRGVQGVQDSVRSSAYPPIRLEIVATGLDQPLHVQAPAGDARLFIVEQTGRIRLVKDGRLVARPFLDLTDRVQSGGERGLLSVAFHPQYAANGRLYVNYTDSEGDTRVVEFRADPHADTASRSTARELFHTRQPYANHNGGHVLFGPDGRLYIGMGDGGAAGDPGNDAQDRRSPLGKLLAIDVDADSIAPAMYARGLRNPWRMAFDSGLLYIADVGQGKWEEINVVPARDSALNYGWRRMEGRHCFIILGCRRGDLVLPVVEYSHDDGCSITGGVVYRGSALPALRGHYFYSDWCEGWLRSFRYAGGIARDERRWPVQRIPSVTSFGTDAAGEVYITSGAGTVYRIAPG